MKLQSFYLAFLLVFLTAATAATKVFAAVAQDGDTETLFTPTTTTANNNNNNNNNNNPSEKPEEAQQQQQQQQIPGVVHHSFVRQQPSPIPADERHVDVDVDVEDDVEDDALLPDQQQQQQQYPDDDENLDTNSQQDQGNNDVGTLEKNVDEEQPLRQHLDHVQVEVESEVAPEQEDGNIQEEEKEEHDTTTTTSTTETFAVKESVHHRRARMGQGQDVSEASEHDVTFYQQLQHQDPAEQLDVEQLKLLLHQRHALDDSDDSIPEEDDRTLLDIFGEVTKEYLTQNVIPETDAECRWDWRSVRCEPACECALKPKRGDYHLGRSCRLRPILDSDDENDGRTCVDVDAATLWLERPATRRMVSLVLQTGQILRDRSAAIVHQVRSGSIQRFHRMQTNVCTDMWTMTHAQVNGGCLSVDDLPMTTIQERILCGPVEFVVCDDDDDEVRHSNSNNHGVNRGGGGSGRRRAGNEPMARRAWADL